MGEGYEPRDWYFLTLRQTFYLIERDLEDWKRGALLDFAFADDVQDIEAFLADPYWAGQYDSIVEEGVIEPSGDVEEEEMPAPTTQKIFCARCSWNEQEYAKARIFARAQGQRDTSRCARHGQDVLSVRPRAPAVLAAHRPVEHHERHEGHDREADAAVPHEARPRGEGSQHQGSVQQPRLQPAQVHAQRFGGAHRRRHHHGQHHRTQAR